MKKRNLQAGIVYSTDPDFSYENGNANEEQTLAPNLQKLVVRLETKHRAGKIVTLIDGFTGTEADRQELNKTLKNHCGTGGSAKDGEILLQGDHREKATHWLLKNGYGLTQKK
jgi:translation initiation factor 1